jgi:RsiW-degrading membrane proteinase PrsW (M82 family)
MFSFKYLFISVLIFPFIFFLYWLSKGNLENKYSLLYLLKVRFDKETVNQTTFLRIKEEVNNNEALLKKLVADFLPLVPLKDFFLTTVFHKNQTFYCVIFFILIGAFQVFLVLTKP